MFIPECDHRSLSHRLQRAPVSRRPADQRPSSQRRPTMKIPTAFGCWPAGTDSSEGDTDHNPSSHGVLTMNHKKHKRLKNDLFALGLCATLAVPGLAGATVLGDGADDGGNFNNTALGQNATATGNNGTATGTVSNATGSESTATGYDAEATQARPPPPARSPVPRRPTLPPTVTAPSHPGPTAPRSARGPTPPATTAPPPA